MDIFYNATLVVGISFALFIALLLYLRVPAFLGKALDSRAAGIRAELDEARKLREEAQEIFAEFERKQRDVEAQSEEIVAHARIEAEAAAEQAKADIAASIERRLKAADEQIALAEASAVREVRDRAITVAIAAATDVLTAGLTDEKAESLVDAAIKDAGARIH